MEVYCRSSLVGILTPGRDFSIHGTTGTDDGGGRFEAAMLSSHGPTFLMPSWFGSGDSTSRMAPRALSYDAIVPSELDSEALLLSEGAGS